GRADEASRLPDRAGGDRGDARRPSGGQPGGGAGARGRRGRRAAGGLRRRQGRAGPGAGGLARLSGGAPARLHGAADRARPGGAAGERAREGGPSRPGPPDARGPSRAEDLGGAAERGGGADRRGLARAVRPEWFAGSEWSGRPERDRGRRQLLRLWGELAAAGEAAQPVAEGSGTNLPAGRDLQASDHPHARREPGGRPDGQALARQGARPYRHPPGVDAPDATAPRSAAGPNKRTLSLLRRLR